MKSDPRIQIFLKILNLRDDTVSMEEVVTAFRNAAKKHHPDLGGDAKKFIQIKEAFDYLQDNYKPRIVKPYVKREQFFRFLKEGLTTHTIIMPEKIFIEPACINCMWGTYDFRLNFDKGYELPKTIKVHNPPLTIKIVSDSMVEELKRYK